MEEKNKNEERKEKKKQSGLTQATVQIKGM